MQGVDVAITMLANDDAVRAVALGELRSSIEGKTIYVDCSTVSPELSGELAESFPTNFLALPVLGGPFAVRAGQAVAVEGVLTGSQDGWWIIVQRHRGLGRADIAAVPQFYRDGRRPP